MSNDNNRLTECLRLDKLVERSMPFSEFLLELKERPEAADSAAALLVRAIKAKGEVEITDAVSLDRHDYLKLLKSLGIPNYMAFERVRGSQRLVARIMKFLEAAAQNGYQLRQMIIIVGGPGCGKSFLADAFKAVLEGQLVFAVKGCPVHENPVNLLKLLKPEQLKQLSEELGMGDKLFEYLKVAGDPCHHCWSQAMKNGDSEPNLAKVQVDELRLSSRHSGVSTWMPSAEGQGCSLISALRQGSRGVVDMPEAFAVIESAPGQAHELDLLLEATENRRVPSGSESCSKTSGYLPLDAVLMLQSNKGAWDRFLKAQPEQDRGKWTRRAKILEVPYNTSRSEEVQAYRDFLEVMKARPHFDPLALWVAATLAVASRMKKDGSGVDLDKRIRMYDGEHVSLPKLSSSLRTSYSEDRWGGTLASASSRQDSSTEDKTTTVEDLWRMAGEDEGMTGLNMGLMLSMISQVCELGLTSKEQCVTALSVLKYLRARIEIEMDTPGLTDAEEEMLKRCKDELLSDFRSSRVGLVEKEYRRMLRQQLIRAFSPDYEKLAAQIFDRYYRYAKAFAKGQDETVDATGRKIKVETEYMEKIERLMNLTTDSERTQFRRSLEAEMIHLRDKHREIHPGEPFEENWRTHPALSRAIAKFLDSEIAKKIERLLTDEIQLKEEEAKLRAESLQRFEELGYTCQHCRKVALEYAKEFKLWSSPEER